MLKKEGEVWKGRQGVLKTPLRGLDVKKRCPVAERVKPKCKKKDSFQLISLVLRLLRKKASPVIFVMGFLIRHCIHKN